MSMSKQDFIALADAIREHNERSQRQTRSYGQDAAVPEFTMDHLETLAAFCKGQNFNFMRDRWTGYISGENGPSGGSIKGKKVA